MAASATPADLFAQLVTLGIQVDVIEHPAAFTVEDLAPHVAHLPGVNVKNLFLCDAKKRMWLVVAPCERRIDLKTLTDRIGSARLSFGSADRLQRVLGVSPGSVCPFAVINDPHQTVQVILDDWMMTQGFINAHPLINTMTVTIAADDLRRFFTACGHRPRTVALDP